MKFPIVYIADNPSAVASAFADKLKEWNDQNPIAPFHIALSGGTTPKLLFEILACDFVNKINWENIHFWWGDERCVDPDDDESNYKWANLLLFEKINIPKQNIHRIKGEENPETEAVRYGNLMLRLAPEKNNIPCFDLVILGLGEDGHTASIFPDNLRLLSSPDYCAVAVHPQSGQKRITLTGTVLNNAQKVAFLVTGRNKSDKVYEIIYNSGNAIEYPASHIKPKNGELMWFLDQNAASNFPE
ncbi:MAG: 6-phosphogluconolactonase [Bacteroidota bacterium]|nr:6-phosphogluconolactonase [Bacteroidota bacterium]